MHRKPNHRRRPVRRRVALAAAVPFLAVSLGGAGLLLQGDGRAARQIESSAYGATLAAQDPFPKKFRLPAEALDGGAGWLNASGPIPLARLRGKVVLLDFWTFCCINCIHILPDLARLEQEFANELI